MAETQAASLGVTPSANSIYHALIQEVQFIFISICSTTLSVKKSGSPRKFITHSNSLSPDLWASCVAFPHTNLTTRRRSFRSPRLLGLPPLNKTPHQCFVNDLPHLLNGCGSSSAVRPSSFEEGPCLVHTQRSCEAYLSLFVHRLIEANFATSVFWTNEPSPPHLQGNENAGRTTLRGRCPASVRNDAVYSFALSSAFRRR